MKKGDVCIIDLSLGTGHEQHGKRPAVLISDTKTNIAIVVPITSNTEALKFPHTLIIAPDKQNKLEQKSIAMIFHNPIILQNLFFCISHLFHLLHQYGMFAVANGL